MGKKNRTQTTGSQNKQSPWALPVVGVIIIAFVIGASVVSRMGTTGSSTPNETTTGTPPRRPSQTPAAPQPVTPNTGQLLSMEVAKAVMVTAELDGVMTIPTALAQIERRYQPDDGVGRTFAILDAYGEQTAQGKLHISMHVSSEKPGIGSLVFKPTGEVLWNSRITQSAGQPAAKSLNIYLADEKGADWIIDGTGNPASILDAKVKDKGIRVRDFWPDGAEREVTFIYSACGCPVKASVRRTGERTVRTKDLPVMFPDDPAGLQTISRLMRW